jgi:folate-binding protein YgfZ
MSWQHILGPQWTITEQHAAIAPQNDTTGDTVAIPLPDLIQIEASGEDVTDFLQGQFSNDIKALDDAHWQFSAYCTPKGRMLALMLITRHDDSYRLILPTEIAEATLKRLQMYVMRAKVTLRLCDDELLLGLAGDNLQALVSAIPQDSHGVSHEQDVSILTIPGASPRILVSGNKEQIGKLWSASEASATARSSKTWRQLNIESGLPQIYEASKEMFIPQMVNMDALDGINFKKGCYPGQEIVARMHYLGKLKKRMYPGTLQSGVDCPHVGDAIYSESFGSQAAGNVVDASINAEGLCELLVSVQISSTSNNDLHLQSLDGPAVTLNSLPYTIPDNSTDKK